MMLEEKPRPAIFKLGPLLDDVKLTSLKPAAMILFI
jgi:hypothetical protein